MKNKIDYFALREAIASKYVDELSEQDLVEIVFYNEMSSLERMSDSELFDRANDLGVDTSEFGDPVKTYNIQWTEIVTYETNIEAESLEKAKELFDLGSWGEVQEVSRIPNIDDMVYIDGEPV